jgi:LmbE family N-acetylglucosaminyl deacetylase
MSDKVAMAISAHPDDIEFYMAGTMLLLSGAGYDLHYLTRLPSPGREQQKPYVRRKFSAQRFTRAFATISKSFMT